MDEESGPHPPPKSPGGRYWKCKEKARAKLVASTYPVTLTQRLQGAHPHAKLEHRNRNTGKCYEKAEARTAIRVGGKTHLSLGHCDLGVMASPWN